MSVEDLNRFYIYTSWHHDTGHPVCFYVGKGSKNRAHSEYDRSAFWWRVAKKHGYTNVIVKDVLTEAEAFELERTLIKSIGRRDLKLGTLVNMTDGGEGTAGYVFSDEAKLKMSVAATGRKLSDETKAKMSATTTGRKLSGTHCQRISDGRKGMKFSDDHRNNMSESRIGKVSKLKGRKRRPRTEEEKLNLSVKLKGIVRSPETRAKMSAAKKKAQT